MGGTLAQAVKDADTMLGIVGGGAGILDRLLELVARVCADFSGAHGSTSGTRIS